MNRYVSKEHGKVRGKEINYFLKGLRTFTWQTYSLLFSSSVDIM
jgi:hypothetical protein